MLIYGKDNPKIKPLQVITAKKGAKIEDSVQEIVVLLRQSQGRSNFEYVDGPPVTKGKKLQRTASINIVPVGVCFCALFAILCRLSTILHGVRVSPS